MGWLSRESSLPLERNSPPNLAYPIFVPPLVSKSGLITDSALTVKRPQSALEEPRTADFSYWQSAVFFLLAHSDTGLPGVLEFLNLPEVFNPFQ